MFTRLTVSYPLLLLVCGAFFHSLSSLELSPEEIPKEEETSKDLAAEELDVTELSLEEDVDAEQQQAIEAQSMLSDLLSVILSLFFFGWFGQRKNQPKMLTRE